jgi:hypothetical protein
VITWQAGALIAKIDAELDVQDDNWISLPEKYAAINEAIDYCERIIHTIHLDYFKKRAWIPIVQGQSDIVLQTVVPDIYATYIRKLYFIGSGQFNPSSSSDSYEMAKIRLNQTPVVQTPEDYQYDVENPDATTGPKLVLYPPARETAAQKVLCFYIRHAQRVSGSTDVIDIPEAHTYIFLYVKKKYLEKDKGNPLLAQVLQELVVEEGVLRNALASMAPEAVSGEIEADYSFYEELY